MSIDNREQDIIEGNVQPENIPNQQRTPIPSEQVGGQYQQYSPIPLEQVGGQYQQYAPIPPEQAGGQYQHYSPIPPTIEKRDRTNEYVLFAVIATIIIAIIVVVVFFGARLFSDISDNGGFRFPFFHGGSTEVVPKDEMNENDDTFGPNSDWGENEGAEGLDSIDPFIAQNLTYTIEDGFWDLMEDSNEGEIFFHIEYPVIKGLSSATVQERINKEIESVAMETRDLMYPDPLPELEEKIYGDSYWFESQVYSKVTYMDENYISIVFEDHYFLGSIFAEYYDMRSLTFDIKTGERVYLDEVLNVTDEFLIEFREKMIMEDTSSSVFSDTEVMSNENLTKILKGRSALDGRYYRLFFLSAKGIDIGVCYHYRSADDNIIARGYTTTLFSYNEIEPYLLPHSMWNAIKNL